MAQCSPQRGIGRVRCELRHSLLLDGAALFFCLCGALAVWAFAAPRAGHWPAFLLALATAEMLAARALSKRRAQPIWLDAGPASLTILYQRGTSACHYTLSGAFQWPDILLGLELSDARNGRRGVLLLAADSMSAEHFHALSVFGRRLIARG